MRIYELARQLAVASKDILLLLEEMGIGGKTASSSVPPAYLSQIRARFAGEEEVEAAAAEAPPKAKPKPAPPKEEPSAPAVPEGVVPAEGDVVKLKAPVTVGGFATALDTDADNVISAAEGLGETVSEEEPIAPELAVLIGEQWGYTVDVEVPEAPPEEAPVETETVAEEAPPAEAEEAEAAAEREKPAEEAPVRPMRVVPRRTAPPDAPERPAVVTVLGHVDHGKTTLLDAIRETNVTAQEPGEITQHIGAYQVEVKGKLITFIDTPGHEAFTAMRARGAQVTDVAVLVVAADDGVMPQTVEAIDHARAAEVPIIVAINKMDRPNVSSEAVKRQLVDRGLVPEEWGGDVICAEISALEKKGLSDLLDMILLVAEMRELRALRDTPAEGVVLEAELDKRRGSQATLLVQEGVLRIGDSIVAGPVAGKIRAMTDDRGRRLKEAGPSTPVQVIGLSDVPEASELFRVVETDRQARAVADETREAQREADLQPVGPTSMLELSELFAEGEAKVLSLILKADAQGTVEAIESALAQMHTEEVAVNVLHTGVGEVTESDVGLAAVTKPTIIIGFQVSADTQARRLAADEHIELRRYEVIYDLLDDIRQTMVGMLEAKYEEVVVGRAEVRALFQSSRVGTIAGCYVLEGRVPRSAAARVRRGGDVVYEGKFASLRHLQDDVSEMNQGFECGIVVEGFSEFEVGDVIEAVEERQVRRAVL
ncbi:MAG: translation initiation factor IF-2 [Armatimonadota bacterium]|nr:MAG: translation initiation factor IF-2 [Armatimonadota bacterium]